MKHIWVYTHSDRPFPMLFSARSKALSQFYKDMKEFKKLGWSNYGKSETNTTQQRCITYRKNNKSVGSSATVMFGFERAQVVD